ncbi:MAG TPA: GNAT family N-acetyltransferase [Caldilineaceae bacterium]|nr:GNAT family N-acetyltransferase [Caldilineaceae bacterium]
MQALSLAEIAELVEANEANRFRTTLACAPPEFAAQYGLSQHEIGGATAFCIEKLPSPVFNRVIGLGLRQPATEAMIDALIAFYERAQTSFGISVSVAARPAQLPAWLLARGFQCGDNWAKMIRNADPPTQIDATLRIERINESKAALYATFIRTGFQLPAWYGSLCERLIEQPNVYAYLAFMEDVPVGTGTLLVSDRVGTLYNGVTQPAYRRRGVQQALMVRRIQDGIGLGCRWFTTETIEDTPEKPNPSYHNMVRSGFQLAYLRPNYIYSNSASQ